MTFEEAKKRPDYKFVLNGIESDIEDIRNNYMKRLYENGDPERGIAILEIGYVDIEVNLMTWMIIIKVTLQDALQISVFVITAFQLKK